MLRVFHPYRLTKPTCCHLILKQSRSRFFVQYFQPIRIQIQRSIPIHTAITAKIAIARNTMVSTVIADIIIRQSRERENASILISNVTERAIEIYPANIQHRRRRCFNMLLSLSLRYLKCESSPKIRSISWMREKRISNLLLQIRVETNQNDIRVNPPTTPSNLGAPSFK